MMRAEQQKIKAIKDYKLACYAMMFILAFFVSLMLYSEATGGNFLHQNSFEAVYIGLVLLYFPFSLRCSHFSFEYPEDCD